MTPNKFLITLGPILIVSACATPREQCISQVSQNYNVLVSAISNTEQNIFRGYAVHKQSVPYSYPGICYAGAITYSCPKTGYRTKETPVAVNVNEERRRLATLKGNFSREKTVAENGIAQCQAAHPK